MHTTFIKTMGYVCRGVPGLVNGGGILWITSQILVYYSMGKTFKATVDWLGMVDNGGVLPSQDVDPSVNGGKAQTGIEFEAPKRDGERINPDGGHSTHIMKTETIDGINWVSFPTLFQNKDGSWDNTYELMIEKDPDNWRPAMLEAKRRDELIHFGPNKKEALEYGEGSWKPKPPPYAQTGIETIYDGGMLPEIEVSALTDDSYNKLSQPQQQVYDSFVTPSGIAQTVDLDPFGDRVMHWKGALQMLEDTGVKNIYNEPTGITGKLFQKLFARRPDQLQVWSNSIFKDITVEGHDKFQSTFMNSAIKTLKNNKANWVREMTSEEREAKIRKFKDIQEQADRRGYFGNVIKELAHIPEFWRWESLKNIPVSFAKDAYRFIKEEEMDHSRYQDKDHYEYKTHTAPDSFEERLKSKYKLQDGGSLPKAQTGNLPFGITGQGFSNIQVPGINWAEGVPELAGTESRQGVNVSGLNLSKDFNLGKNWNLNLSNPALVYARPTLDNMPVSKWGAFKGFPFEPKIGLTYNFKDGGSLPKFQGDKDNSEVKPFMDYSGPLPHYYPDKEESTDKYVFSSPNEDEWNIDDAKYFDHLLDEKVDLLKPGFDFMKDWTNSGAHRRMLNKSVANNPSWLNQNFGYNSEKGWIMRQERDNNLGNWEDKEFKFYMEPMNQTSRGSHPLASQPGNGPMNINGRFIEADNWDDEPQYINKETGEKNYPDYKTYKAARLKWGQAKGWESDGYTYETISDHQCEGVGCHEYSHASDASTSTAARYDMYGRLIPAADVELMKNSYSSDYDKDNKRHQYLASPTETRARLNEIRKVAFDNNLWDVMNKKPTREQFNKLTERKKSWKYNTGLYDLRQIHDDDAIFNMLNNVSDASEEIGGDDLPIVKNAKYGGSLPIAQDGTEKKDDNLWEQGRDSFKDWWERKTNEWSSGDTGGENRREPWDIVGCTDPKALNYCSECVSLENANKEHKDYLKTDINWAGQSSDILDIDHTKFTQDHLCIYKKDLEKDNISKKINWHYRYNEAQEEVMADELYKDGNINWDDYHDVKELLNAKLAHLKYSYNDGGWNNDGWSASRDKALLDRDIEFLKLKLEATDPPKVISWDYMADRKKPIPVPVRKKEELIKIPPRDIQSLPVNIDEPVLSKALPYGLYNDLHYTTEMRGKRGGRYIEDDDGKSEINLRDQAGRLIWSGTQTEFKEKYGDHLKRGTTEYGDKRKSRWYPNNYQMQDGAEINERDRFIKFIKENEGGHDYIRNKNSAIKKLGEDDKWDGESYYKIFDEGTQKYYPYFLDDEGGATIGHGHHNDDVYETYKDGITIEKAEELLNTDVDDKLSDTEIWWTSKYGDEEWGELDESTQYMLGDMAYNTGHIRNYKLFADAIKRGDFEAAENEYIRKDNEGGNELGRNKTYLAEYLKPWIDEQKLKLPAPPLNEMPLPIGVFPIDGEGIEQPMTSSKTYMEESSPFDFQVPPAVQDNTRIGTNVFGGWRDGGQLPKAQDGEEWKSYYPADEKGDFYNDEIRPENQTEYDKVNKMLLDYMQSPVYLQRLKDQGYKDPKKTQQLRLDAFNTSNVVEKEGHTTNSIFELSMTMPDCGRDENGIISWEDMDEECMKEMDAWRYKWNHTGSYTDPLTGEIEMDLQQLDENNWSAGITYAHEMGHNVGGYFNNYIDNTISEEDRYAKSLSWMDDYLLSTLNKNWQDAPWMGVNDIDKYETEFMWQGPFDGRRDRTIGEQSYYGSYNYPNKVNTLYDFDTISMQKVWDVNTQSYILPENLYARGPIRNDSQISDKPYKGKINPRFKEYLELQTKIKLLKDKYPEGNWHKDQEIGKLLEESWKLQSSMYQEEIPGQTHIVPNRKSGATHAIGSPESYGDLYGLRYFAHQNLKNDDGSVWTPDQVFTQDHWSQLLEKYKADKKDGKENLIMQRMIQRYKKQLEDGSYDTPDNGENIIEIMNRVATEQEGMPLGMSKYGGQHDWALDLRSSKIPRAQAGKEVKSDDIYSNDRYSQSASKYKKMLPKYQNEGELPKAQWGQVAKAIPKLYRKGVKYWDDLVSKGTKNLSKTVPDRGTTLNKYGQIKTSFDDLITKDISPIDNATGKKGNYLIREGNLPVRGTGSDLKIQVHGDIKVDKDWMVQIGIDDNRGMMQLVKDAKNPKLYHMDMSMKNPFEAGQTMKYLEEFLPKGSIITSNSLSMDSYKLMTNQIKHGRFTHVSDGTTVPLNMLSKNMNFKENLLKVDAQNSVNKINKMLDNAGIKERARMFQDADQIGNVWNIEVPNLRLKMEYQRGGELPKAQFGRHSIMSGDAYGTRPAGTTGMLGDIYKKTGFDKWSQKYMPEGPHTAAISGLLDIVSIPGNLATEAVEYFGERGDKEFNFSDAMPGWSGDFSFTNANDEPMKTVSQTTDADGKPLVDNFWGGLSLDIITDPSTWIGAGLIKNFFTKGSKILPKKVISKSLVTTKELDNIVEGGGDMYLQLNSLRIAHPKSAKKIGLTTDKKVKEIIINDPKRAEKIINSSDLTTSKINFLDNVKLRVKKDVMSGLDYYKLGHGRLRTIDPDNLLNSVSKMGDDGTTSLYRYGDSPFNASGLGNSFSSQPKSGWFSADPMDPFRYQDYRGFGKNVFKIDVENQLLNDVYRGGFQQGSTFKSGTTFKEFDIPEWLIELSNKKNLGNMSDYKKYLNTLKQRGGEK